MVIPTLHGYKFNIGDEVILIKDYDVNYAIFLKGHIMTIIDKDEYGFILSDKDNNVLDHVNFSIISPNITIEESRKIYQDRKQFDKYKSIIIEKCKYHYFEYDRYDRYDMCNKIKENVRISCKCKIECYKYVNKDSIKEKDKIWIEKYLRNFKVKKLKEKLYKLKK